MPRELSQAMMQSMNQLEAVSQVQLLVQYYDLGCCLALLMTLCLDGVTLLMWFG